MKRSILIGTILCLIHADARSQQLPNPGFESWSQEFMYREPAGYTTSNPETYFEYEGLVGLTRILGENGATSQAVKLAVLTPPEDSVNIFMFIGRIVDNDPLPADLLGGFPYTQRPSSFHMRVRNHLENNDTSYVVLAFNKNGANIGSPYILPIDQSNQDWHTLNFNLVPPLGQDPDSIFFGVTLFQPGTDRPGEPGTYIEIDSVWFNTTAPIPNGGFNQWNEFNMEVPEGWNTTNPWSMILHGKNNVTQSSDARSGSSSARIETRSFGGPDSEFGWITLGRTENFNSGGIPSPNKPMYFNGWYKYAPPSGTPDTANIRVIFTRWNTGTNAREWVGFAGANNLLQSNWSSFSLPVTYLPNQDPDSVNVLITSSTLTEGKGAPGGILNVDDLAFSDWPVGMDLNKAVQTNAYPNPARDRVQFQLGGTGGELKVELYNGNGTLVQVGWTDASGVLPLREHAPGLYHFVLSRGQELGFGSLRIQ